MKVVSLLVILAEYIVHCHNKDFTFPLALPLLHISINCNPDALRLSLTSDIGSIKLFN